MKNVTRLAAWISGALLAFGLATAPAPAQAARAHDVHVTAVDHYCANQKTVYTFKLENFSGERRTLRGEIARKGGGYGITETFARNIRRGVSVQRVVVRLGDSAVATLRSQGRIVMRAHLSSQCRRILPAPLA